MVGGVGMSSLQAVDLRLSRNIAVLGIALIMCGFIVPRVYMTFTPKTGNAEFDQLLETLLTNEMILGGVAGFLLDNTVPGATKSQLGICPYHDGDVAESDVVGRQSKSSEDVYGFPDFVKNILEKIPYYHLVPTMPPPRSR